MPIVYCTNRGGHDYSPARAFGELVFITEGKLDKWDVSQMVRECRDAFKDSTEDDYILLTSLTTLCSIACAVFCHMHGRLNLLIYKDDGYVERKIVLEENHNYTRSVR